MNNFRRLTNNFILLAFLLILMLFLFRSQIFVAPDMQDFTLNRFEEEVTQGNVE
ncbi:hypothetical protein HKBW3S34_00394, partial [Candidatus Hakubella thermalkaliphila]